MTPAEFCERFSAELPSRIHSRDTDEGGNIDYHPAFIGYITDGEGGHFAASYREDQEVCHHPTILGSAHCPTCDNTGLRIRARNVFRHPMKRALDDLSKIPVPSGRPRLDVALRALALHDGNMTMAIASLGTQYSSMRRPRWAHGYMLRALREVSRVYREDTPARVLRDRSDAQLNAEAA